jgi:hypothetical protein
MSASRITTRNGSPSSRDEVARQFSENSINSGMAMERLAGSANQPSALVLVLQIGSAY